MQSEIHVGTRLLTCIPRIESAAPGRCAPGPPREITPAPRRRPNYVHGTEQAAPASGMDRTSAHVAPRRRLCYRSAIRIFGSPNRGASAQDGGTIPTTSAGSQMCNARSQTAQRRKTSASPIPSSGLPRYPTRRNSRHTGADRASKQRFDMRGSHAHVRPPPNMLISRPYERGARTTHGLGKSEATQDKIPAVFGTPR